MGVQCPGIEQSAAADGVRRLTLETAENQPEAASLYESIGYQRTGTETRLAWTWTFIRLAKDIGWLPCGQRSSGTAWTPQPARRTAAQRQVLDRQVVTCVWLRRVGDVFKAIADPTRRAILDELADRDGQTLFELCARLASRHGLASTRQAISQHLEVLESAALVKTRREGRYKFHHLDTAPLLEIMQRWPIPTTEESS